MGAGECQHQALLLHPAGHSQSATSSCIPHGSFFMLLFLPLVPASFRAILLLLFLASSTLSIPGIFTLLVLAVAGGDKCGNTWMGIHHPGGELCPLPPSCFPTGHWLVVSVCHVAGRIQPVVPQEEPRYRLTSTPER